ncbi:retrovirus-related pol polyprotein from transposon TNT 1-94 [Tanacetum coccineum]
MDKNEEVYIGEAILGAKANFLDPKGELRKAWSQSPHPTKLSPLVDDDVGGEEAIENNIKVVNNNNIEDESIEVDEDCIKWQEELNQFVANDVWDLVPLPKNQSIIGTKCIYSNKLDENGIVSRNKARLVAQGYSQQEGIDYDETYASVARLESIRLLLAIACAKDFKLFQMDVKSAFLNGFINKEVYVAQPLGFIDFEKPNYVYKLKKALYSLKQAPKAWGVELLLGSSNKTNGRRDIFQIIQIHQGDVKEVRVGRFQTNQDADVNGDQAHQGQRSRLRG